MEPIFYERIAFVVLILMFFAKDYFYNRLLELKSESGFRTPIKIRGRFYYIVPESEYNQQCWHDGYEFKAHGRRCHKCGKTLTDFGD